MFTKPNPMDKKQAEQEILRRLDIYYNRFSFGHLASNKRFDEYKSGNLSKQELIKMITLDEDGNFLSEPKAVICCNGGYSNDTACGCYGKPINEEWYVYQKALNQATEIVNCYDGE